MKNVGGTKITASIESLIWRAQGAAQQIERAAKRDAAISSQARFDEALDARRDAAAARFAKGGKENRSSFWTNVGVIAGLVAAVLVAAALSVPTGGVSLALAGALVAAAGGGTAALAKLLCFVAWDRHTRGDERRANESDVRASEAQKASDAAQEEARAAHDR